MELRVILEQQATMNNPQKCLEDKNPTGTLAMLCARFCHLQSQYDGVLREDQINLRVN